MSEDKIIKTLRLKHREWVEDNVDWTPVSQGDLHYIKDIVKDIVNFDPSYAKIQVDIVRARAHYNVIFKNWNKPIQEPKFYNTFFNPETRDYKYDTVKETFSIIPNPDGDTHGPVVQIYITRRSVVDK